MGSPSFSLIFNQGNTFIMDNKEGTFIGLGCLALCSLYYFFRQYSKESNLYRSKRRQLQDRKIHQNTNIDLSSVKDKKELVLLLPKVQIKNIPADAFRIFHREIKKPLLSTVLQDSFVESQTGGRFLVKHNGQQITVDIKSCNISTEILEEKKQSNIIFPQNEGKDPLFYSLTYSLKRMKNLTLYGMLKYSFTDKKFIFEPEFMLKPLKSTEDIIEKISSFWDEKIYRITFRKLVICFGMLVSGYLLIYRPIRNIWERAKIKKEGISQGQFKYFKNKVNFSASIPGGLKCEFCKEANISYVYECGHLVACENCHKQQQNVKCTICNKKSKKFMKIFI